MDAGRFESVSKPYPFHTVVRSMLAPLRLTADAKGLELIFDLDKNIDNAARHALYSAQGHDESWIREKMATDDDDGGLITGDEMRFRQIINNLTR